jgi:hypothetical protein
LREFAISFLGYLTTNHSGNVNVWNDLTFLEWFVSFIYLGK